jgi:hypothetical protein
MAGKRSRTVTSPARRVAWSVVIVAVVVGATLLATNGVIALVSGSRPVTPVTASAKAVRVQANVPVGPGTPGTTPVYPPGPAGCGLPSAAFCENFDGGRNTAGNRTGDVSPTLFSLARWRSELGQEPNLVQSAQIPACRSGAGSAPLPSSAIQTPYALVATAEQNYGDNSYRLAPQFDIAGRTGTIRFDTSLDVQDGLLGWPVMAFTSEPYNAPSYLADNSAGPTPSEGIEIQFKAVCPGPSGWTPFPTVRTYSRHQESEINDENGLDSSCPNGVTAQAGHLNRVEIRISQTHVEMWASDASGDGVNFGGLRKVYSAPINLSFTRGYVYIGVHNHATVKYANLPSWNVPWDNIAFDGPQIPNNRTYQVDNSMVPSGGGMDLGWWLPNSATGATTPALTLGGVSTAGAASGRLVFDMAADPITNTNYGSWRVNYQINGGAVHSVGFSADELALVGGRAGSYIFSVPVDLAEFRDGSNTVQFSGTGFYGGYQPYIGNVDLVLS